MLILMIRKKTTLSFTILFQLLVVQHVQLTCTCRLAIAALITALKIAVPLGPRVHGVLQSTSLWQ